MKIAVELGFTHITRVFCLLLKPHPKWGDAQPVATSSTRTKGSCKIDPPTPVLKVRLLRTRKRTRAEHTEVDRGSGRAHALTWNPSLVQLIRGKAGSGAAARCPGRRFPGDMKESSRKRKKGQKMRRLLSSSSSSPSSSSSSLLCAVRHEDCGRVRLEPHAGWRGVGVEGWTSC